MNLQKGVNRLFLPIGGLVAILPFVGGLIDLTEGQPSSIILAIPISCAVFVVIGLLLPRLMYSLISWIIRGFQDNGNQGATIQNVMKGDPTRRFSKDWIIRGLGLGKESGTGDTHPFEKTELPYPVVSPLWRERLLWLLDNEPQETLRLFWNNREFLQRQLDIQVKGALQTYHNLQKQNTKRQMRKVSNMIREQFISQPTLNVLEKDKLYPAQREKILEWADEEYEKGKKKERLERGE